MDDRVLPSIGFVTTNIGKLQEAQEILCIPLVQINMSFQEPQEVRGEEIAAAKARTAYLEHRLPLFADHTSLYIEAWNNLPGGLTGTFLRQVGDVGLINMMSAFKNRRAVGQTVIAFCDGPSPTQFIGSIKGTIVPIASGQEYTGWDRIFVPDGYSKTYGDMTFEEKNNCSQRRIALLQFREFLSHNYPSFNLT